MAILGEQLELSEFLSSSAVGLKSSLKRKDSQKIRFLSKKAASQSETENLNSFSVQRNYPLFQINALHTDTDVKCLFTVIFFLLVQSY